MGLELCWQSARARLPDLLAGGKLGVFDITTPGQVAKISADVCPG